MYDKTVSEEEKAWGGAGDPPAMDNTPLPDDFAPFICYLCTDAAAAVNGFVFNLKSHSVNLYSDPVIIRSITKNTGERWTVEELIKEAPAGLFDDYHSVVDMYK